MRLCRPSFPSANRSFSTSSSSSGFSKLSPFRPFQHEFAPSAAQPSLHTVGVTGSAAHARGGHQPDAAPALRAPVTPPSSLASNPVSGETPTTVEFFYDILSPYSYFAFETLCRYREEWNINLQLKPCFLSAIMQRTANSPPGMVAAKGSYMKKDLYRLSNYFEVPIQFPRALKEVMFGSLPVQRILAAVAMHKPAALESVTRAFWVRHWGRDEDILSREGQIAALTRDTGLSQSEAEELLGASTTAEVKQLLQRYTEEALSYGAFGVPSIVLTAPATPPASSEAHTAPAAAPSKQLLFGSDRFHVMAAMLRKEWMGPKPNKRKIISRL